MKRNPLVLLSRGAAYALLCLMAALTLTPLFWLVAAAFKAPDDLFHYLFFPPLDKFSLVNFQDLFKTVPFARYLINSTFVAGTTVMVQLFFSSLAGFALAKYEFVGKRAFMVLMLATLMIPGQVTMAPLYELIYRLGLMDSYAGLIVPQAVSVFGIFLFRQYFLQLPDELLHAARIDGCSEFGIYWNVIMPVSRPMVGAFCLISFMATWNSFLWPLIIVNDTNQMTVPLGLQLFLGQQGQRWELLMAAATISMVPTVLLVLALQKYLVRGIALSGLGGR